jgi:tetratricopeptide (TPR) repeat protein
LLGDLLHTAGDDDGAATQYDLVRAEAGLFAANGVNTDLEIALFDADHGDPAASLAAARDEWARRHSIHVADALAWALHANGRDREAVAYSDQALALDTQNALLFAHAGLIRQALGQRDEARSLLSQAESINPHFSVLLAPRVYAALAELGVSR